MKNLDLSLYLVTDRSFLRGRNLCDVVAEAVNGGVSIVQLREKTCSSREFYELALALKQTLQPLNVPLIINDRLDIALAVDADGLHIGQSDLPCEEVRRFLGSSKIVGLSVENDEDAIEANKLDIDYIGISPVFDTTTKIDTAHALGIEGVKRITKISKVPAVGIGGINATNATEIVSAGASGISVVSAIMASENPCKSSENLKQIVCKALQNRKS